MNIAELRAKFPEVVQDEGPIFGDYSDRISGSEILLRKDHQAGEQGHFDLKIEKRRLASYLGMTAENLSRAIRTLNGYGVEIEGSQVRITDRKDLAAFAKPTPLIDDPKC